MKKILSLLFFIGLLLMGVVSGQNIGVGTISPAARLHVADSSVLFSAVAANPLSPGDPPASGAGRRTMWYADKGAFRTGYIEGAEWDKNNVGAYSFASGYSTTASGFASFTTGYATTANGDRAAAMGYQTTASGPFSVAMGTGSVASGVASFALGYNTSASNDATFATGFGTNASGYYSTAMGNYATASAIRATAIGYNVTANGASSVAMGSYVSTSGYNGAFALGDNSTTTIMGSFVDNGFRSRFAGGYRLLTNSAATIGVVLLASGNAWSAISDARLKENFIPVDGESFLKKIARMPLTTWNYKDQDAKTLRHYGPMAQDFYKAFGHDTLGEIGCDTLINQQDFLGVNLIAIQALEKRTKLQEKEIEDLKASNALLQQQVRMLMKKRK